MVIEVGYLQSLPDLHQKVTLYFSQETSIQIVLIIKIFDLRVDNNTFALIAALYLRTNQNPLIPVNIISFGFFWVSRSCTINCELYHWYYECAS